MKDVILSSQSELAFQREKEPYSYFLLETDKFFATEKCRLDILNSDTQYLSKFFALRLMAVFL